MLFGFTAREESALTVSGQYSRNDSRPVNSKPTFWQGPTGVGKVIFWCAEDEIWAIAQAAENIALTQLADCMHPLLAWTHGDLKDNLLSARWNELVATAGGEKEIQLSDTATAECGA